MSELGWMEELSCRCNEVLVGTRRECRRATEVCAAQILRAHLSVRRALSTGIRLRAAKVRAEIGGEEVRYTLAMMILEGSERVG